MNVKKKKSVRSPKRTVRVSSARGVLGCVVSEFGETVFRVYAREGGRFVDYALEHGELEVVITAPDAVFRFKPREQPSLDRRGSVRRNPA